MQKQYNGVDHTNLVLGVLRGYRHVRLPMYAERSMQLSVHPVNKQCFRNLGRCSDLHFRSIVFIAGGFA